MRKQRQRHAYRRLVGDDLKTVSFGWPVGVLGTIFFAVAAHSA
jgi:hypothetical protein